MAKNKTESAFQQRSLTSPLIKWVTITIAVTWGLVQLFVAIFPIATNSLIGFHVSFGLAFGLIIFPSVKRAKDTIAKILLGVDLILALLATLPGLYIVFFQQEIMLRMGEVTPLEYFLGGAAIILVVELARRVMGGVIVSLCIAAILYAHFGYLIPGPLGHRGFSAERIISQLYLTTEGIFTIPIQVSATFVFLFILFGTYLQQAGGGAFFVELATSILGRFRGGPAKIAVMASSLMGMLSGSAVANVAVTGSVTIPMMKRTGYRPHIAGAIEAAASNGGQFMPPIMGAAAFIIPSMIGGNCSYWDVVKAAFIPGALYFIAVFIAVDIEAAKANLKGMAKTELPSLSKSLKGGWHLLSPILILIYLLAVVQSSPQLAAFWATVTLFVVSFMRKASRLSVEGYLEVFRKTASAAVVVVSACAMGGIIIGCIMLTGLGMALSSILVDLAQGSLILLLVLTMLTSIILGMGMTTTAVYIILAILVVPALVKMGVQPIAAHLFIFYFGIVSSLTPPVALSAFAGAGIAGSDPTQTGYAAFRIGIAAFLLPYMFVYGPALLLHGTLPEVALAVATAVVGVYSLVAAIQGHMKGPLSLLERGILFAAALSLIFQGLISDAVGFGLFMFVVISNMRRAKALAA